ncbi:MAG: M23 family metallopeptidase, partial [Sphingomonadales bacterium]|nr:M23 family metallopeptidase [Sphingomonadales bacterium]
FRNLGVLVGSLWGLVAAAQPWIHPIAGRPLSSGVFGELRTNHLHSGLDYRTGSEIGVPILAVANGHVARIKTSATGYGLALYLDHPGGYTTVYAHLDRYASPIAEWMKARHYQYIQFELDMALKPHELPVKQGQIIGYSGNSGGSGGPHLHFEVRHTLSEDILNPQHFGLRLIDHAAPFVQSIQLVQIPGIGYSDEVLGRTVLYPDQEPAAKIRSKKKRKGKRSSKRKRTASNPLRKPNPTKATYLLTSEGYPVDTLKHPTHLLRYPAYLELMARDRQDSNELTTGVYRIVILQNRDTVYDFRADRFHFDQTRYGNSVMDYLARIKDRSQKHRCQRSPGNLLTMYGNTMRNGLLFPSGQGQMDSVQAWCYDFNDNSIGYGFTIAPDTLGPSTTKPYLPRSHAPHQGLSRTVGGFKVNLPPGTVYDSISLQIKALPVGRGAVSQHEYLLHDPRIPVHQAFEVCLPAKPGRLHPGLRNKVLLRTRGLSGQIAHLTGRWEGDHYHAQAKMFGRLDLVLDTVPPTIRSLLKPKELRRQRGQSLYFRIQDGMAGIADYRFCAGDAWILPAYDAKNNLLQIRLDECIPLGKQSMELLVTDKVGNSRVHRFPLEIEDFAQPTDNTSKP